MAFEHEPAVRMLLAGDEELGEAVAHDHRIVRDVERRGGLRRRFDLCLIALGHERRAHPGWSDQAVDERAGERVTDRESETAEVRFVLSRFRHHLAGYLSLEVLAER